MAFACISIGSNLAQPKKQVTSGINTLSTLPQSTLIAQSKLTRTKPWGKEDQPDFVNAVAALNTALTPLALLDELQKIEHSHGRERSIHWGPRTLDLDIICYDQLQLQHPRLTLPHPHFHQRAFVLEPLCELFPDHVINGKSAQQWLAQLREKEQDKN